jgi:hypothetical protein
LNSAHSAHGELSRSLAANVDADAIAHGLDRREENIEIDFLPAAGTPSQAGQRRT